MVGNILLGAATTTTTLVECARAFAIIDQFLFLLASLLWSECGILVKVVALALVLLACCSVFRVMVVVRPGVKMESVLVRPWF